MTRVEFTDQRFDAYRNVAEAHCRHVVSTDRIYVRSGVRGDARPTLGTSGGRGDDRVRRNREVAWIDGPVLARVKVIESDDKPPSMRSARSTLPWPERWRLITPCVFWPVGSVDAVAEVAFTVPTATMLTLLGVVGDPVGLIADVGAIVAVIGRGAASTQDSDAAAERLLATFEPH